MNIKGMTLNEFFEGVKTLTGGMPVKGYRITRKGIMLNTGAYMDPGYYNILFLTKRGEELEVESAHWNIRESSLQGGIDLFYKGFPGKEEALTWEQFLNLENLLREEKEAKEALIRQEKQLDRANEIKGLILKSGKAFKIEKKDDGCSHLIVVTDTTTRYCSVADFYVVLGDWESEYYSSVSQEAVEEDGLDYYFPNSQEEALQWVDKMLVELKNSKPYRATSQYQHELGVPQGAYAEDAGIYGWDLD